VCPKIVGGPVGQAVNGLAEDADLFTVSREQVMGLCEG
jgi:hypothetical protein